MMFRRESLLDIIAFLERALATAPRVTIEVLDPDRGRGAYAGEIVEEHVHRPFRVWVDLAERLGWRLLTPRTAEAPRVALTFEKLDPASRLRPSGERTERYGAASPFARISKHEDPGFVVDLREALDRVGLAPDARVLDLGVNTGDELALVLAMCPQLSARSLSGVDHSASALAVARTRFPDATLIEADLNTLRTSVRYDLVISIGTLQSPGIDDRGVLRRIVQDHLAPDGAVIVGFPNCRYVDGETEYGARMLNYRQPELGLLVKDVAFYRKYLQQHGRQVFVTGKNYLLVTATRSPA